MSFSSQDLLGMPPRRKTRVTKRSRKARKTRKQKGGSLAKRVMRNVQAVGLETKEAYSNYFYLPKEDDLYHGNAMFIGPRFEYGAGEKNLNAKAAAEKMERKAAKYPYEECLFFFEVELPNDPGGKGQYPYVPPIFKHKTAGIINYRLHPNLYGYGRFTEGGIDEKTCLGILNTFGQKEWNPEGMTLSSILIALQAVFGDNPGMSEPAWGHLRHTNPQGALYNQHVQYEAIDITSKLYNMIVKSLVGTSTANDIRFNNAKVAAEKIPPYVKPFLPVLAKRAYSALKFLIGKLELFIEAHDGKSVLDLPAYAHHHDAKRADFGALIERMEATIELIPKALRINVFMFGIGETHRALYEFSKPRFPPANGETVGRLMTYEEFVEDMIERDREKRKKNREAKMNLMRRERLGLNAAKKNENENEEEEEEQVNTTEYVYENNYSGNNGSNNGGNDVENVG